MVDLLQSLFAIETDFPFDAVKQTSGVQLLLERPLDACVLVAQLDGQVIPAQLGPLACYSGEEHIRHVLCQAVTQS